MLQVDGPRQSAFDWHCTQVSVVVLHFAAAPLIVAAHWLFAVHLQMPVAVLHVPLVQSAFVAHCAPKGMVKSGAGLTMLHLPVTGSLLARPRSLCVGWGMKSCSAWTPTTTFVSSAGI